MLIKGIHDMGRPLLSSSAKNLLYSCPFFEAHFFPHYLASSIFMKSYPFSILFLYSNYYSKYPIFFNLKHSQIHSVQGSTDPKQIDRHLQEFDKLWNHAKSVSIPINSANERSKSRKYIKKQFQNYFNKFGLNGDLSYVPNNNKGILKFKFFLFPTTLNEKDYSYHLEKLFQAFEDLKIIKSNYNKEMISVINPDINFKFDFTLDHQKQMVLNQLKNVHKISKLNIGNYHLKDINYLLYYFRKNLEVNENFEEIFNEISETEITNDNEKFNNDLRL